MSRTTTPTWQFYNSPEALTPAVIADRCDWASAQFKERTVDQYREARPSMPVLVYRLLLEQQSRWPALQNTWTQEEADLTALPEHAYLRKADGSRAMIDNNWLLDPAAPEAQAAAVRWLERDLGSARGRRFDGLTWDNVPMTPTKYRKAAGGKLFSGQGREYDDASWQAAVKAFLDRIRAAFPALYMMGNVIGVPDKGQTYLFVSALDGIFLEGMVGYREIAGSVFLRNNLAAAREFLSLSDRKSVFAYAIGTQEDSARWQFSLAWFLLLLPPGTVTIQSPTGETRTARRGAFRYGANESVMPDAHRHWWDSPLYDLPLGEPLGEPQQVATDVWERQFEQAIVRVDLNTKTATITPRAQQPAPAPLKELAQKIGALTAENEALKAQVAALQGLLTTLEAGQQAQAAAFQAVQGQLTELRAGQQAQATTAATMQTALAELAADQEAQATAQRILQSRLGELQAGQQTQTAAVDTLLTRVDKLERRKFTLELREVEVEV